MVVWDFFHQQEHPKLFHKKLLVFLVSIPKKGINFFLAMKVDGFGSHFGEKLEFPLGQGRPLAGSCITPPQVSAHSPQGKKHGKGSMMGKPRRFHWANGAAKLALVLWSPPFWRPNKPHPHTNMILPMMLTSFQTRNSLEKKNSSFHIPSTYTTPLQHCV